MGKTINIGIDADGVIFDLFRFQIEKGLKDFKKIDNDILVNDLTIEDIFKIENYSDFKSYVIEYLKEYNKEAGIKIDYEGYDVSEIFKCSHLRRQIFWMFNIYDYCMNSKTIDNAVEVIKKWKSEGKKIYNITARVFVTDNGPLGVFFRKMLYLRYEKEGIEFDGIDLCSEKGSAVDKFIACNKRQVDFLLEDKLDNACYIKDNSNITKVLLMDSPYNKNDKFDDEVIINSFEEADKIISDYENNLKIELQDHNYVVNGKLKRIKKEETLTSEQLLDYYQQRKEYYASQPYDEKKFKLGERLYKLSYYMIVPIFNAFNNTKVVNKEKVPYQDGAIYISNHRGSLDQFALLKAVGSKPIHFLVHEKLLKLRRGKLYKNVGSIFITPGNLKSSLRALKEMTEVNARNKNLYIFPEGTRNRDKTKYMLDFADGVFSVAQATGGPIVPLAINDEYKFRSKGVIVRVGDPVVIQPGEDITKVKEDLRETIGTMIWENMEDTANRKLESLKKKYYFKNFMSKTKSDLILQEIEKLEKALLFSPKVENDNKTKKLERKY